MMDIIDKVVSKAEKDGLNLILEEEEDNYFSGKAEIYLKKDMIDYTKSLRPIVVDLKKESRFSLDQRDDLLFIITEKTDDGLGTDDGCYIMYCFLEHCRFYFLYRDDSNYMAVASNETSRLTQEFGVKKAELIKKFGKEEAPLYILNYKFEV